MNNEDHLLAYGKICWLWSNSNLHKDWPITLQTRFVIPPVFLKQYMILEHGGMPVAYCSWAMINQETESKYILSPSSIAPHDWNNGDRLWFIDWISPFSHRHTWTLKRAITKRFPKKIGRAIRVKKNDDTAHIATFTGIELARTQKQDLREKYFQETITGLTANVIDELK